MFPASLEISFKIVDNYFPRIMVVDKYFALLFIKKDFQNISIIFSSLT